LQRSRCLLWHGGRPDVLSAVQVIVITRRTGILKLRRFVSDVSRFAECVSQSITGSIVLTEVRLSGTVAAVLAIRSGADRVYANILYPHPSLADPGREGGPPRERIGRRPPREPPATPPGHRPDGGATR
jgi:hypothetical protein